MPWRPLTWLNNNITKIGVLTNFKEKFKKPTIQRVKYERYPRVPYHKSFTAVIIYTV